MQSTCQSHRIAVTKMPQCQTVVLIYREVEKAHVSFDHDFHLTQIHYVNAQHHTWLISGGRLKLLSVKILWFICVWPLTNDGLQLQPTHCSFCSKLQLLFKWTVLLSSCFYRFLLTKKNEKQMSLIQSCTEIFDIVTKSILTESIRALAFD